jgi:hypothetical protein
MSPSSDERTSNLRPEDGRTDELAPTLNEPVGTDQLAPTLDDPVSSGTHPPPAAGGARPVLRGYRLDGVLGRGGMGIVYKGEHLALKRTVAIKMILAGAHAGSEESARFRAEAEAVARLQHPNIVQVFEVGEADGRPYFALEFVDGGSLAGALAATPQEPRASAQLVLALAGAVQAAHDKGVVHRDLKPANILLHRKSETQNPKSEMGSDLGFRISDFEPKVTDFGLAKLLDADTGRTQTGQVMGTPSYMAPEQAAGDVQAVGPAADVYALGAILYECLTGRPPFKAAAVLDTLEQVRTREPVAPRQLQPSVPRDLETICLKCLQKDPARRYAGARALADDLARFGRGEPITARPVGAGERLAKWVRRNPAVAGLLALVFLSLAAGTVVSVSFAVRSGRNADRALEAEGKAKARAKEAEDARDRAEDMLARSWFGAIGSRRGVLLQGGLVPEETETLWEVAGSAGTRAPLVLLDRGLESVGTARQMSPRVEVVALAVAGLDHRRREAALTRVRARLRDPAAAPELRQVCAALVGVLRDDDAESCRLAAETTLESLDRTDAVAERMRLANVLAGARGLRREDADAVVRTLLQEMPQSLESDLMGGYALSVKAVAPRLSADAAAEGARSLLPLLNRLTPASKNVLNLMTALTALVDRLGQERPHEAARLVLEVTASTRNTDHLSLLARSFEAAAARLTGAESAACAQVIVAAMAKAQMPGVLPTLRRALKVVAGKLDRATASAAARDILALPNWPLRPSELPHLVGALCVLGDRLDRDEAGRNAAAAARALLRCLADVPPVHLHLVVAALKEAAPALDAAEGTPIARDLLGRLSRATDDAELAQLTDALLPLADRLGKEEAAPVARSLQERTAHAADPNLAAARAREFRALADRLDRDEAGRLAATAARALVDRAAKGRPGDIASWQPAFQTVAALLPADEAAALAEQLLALTGDADPDYLSAVVLFRDVAPRLGNEQAAAAARTLRKRIGEAATRSPNSVPVLAGGLLPLAERLPDGEAWECLRVLLARPLGVHDLRGTESLAEVLPALASRLRTADAATAARLLTEQIEKTTETGVLPALVATLLAAAERAGAAEGQAPIAAAARAIVARAEKDDTIPALPPLLKRLDENPARTIRAAAVQTVLKQLTWVTKGIMIPNHAKAVQALAGLMTPDEAAPAARLLLDRTQLVNDRISFAELTSALKALATSLRREEAAALAQALQEKLAIPDKPLFLPSYADAFKVVAGGLDEQDLVNLLKQPTCVGSARDVVLDEFGRRRGRTFADVWELADWLREHEPDVDLAAPPRRLRL